MRRLHVLLLVCLFIGRPAKADFFGADVAVLTQILAQSIEQYLKLKELVGASQDQLDLIRQINQGINDSLNFLSTIQPNTDPGIYADWSSTNDGLAKLAQIYGKVPDSPESRVQSDTDQGVAEAIAFNNGFYSYTRELDSIGGAIQEQSHAVSPGGAAKLTAQALGIIIQVLNQNLRAQSTILKMHAQDVAVKNRQEKAATGQFLESGRALQQAMKNESVKFQVPRF